MFLLLFLLLPRGYHQPDDKSGEDQGEEEERDERNPNTWWVFGGKLVIGAEILKRLNALASDQEKSEMGIRVSSLVCLFLFFFFCFLGQGAACLPCLVAEGENID